MMIVENRHADLRAPTLFVGVKHAAKHRLHSDSTKYKPSNLL